MPEALVQEERADESAFEELVARLSRQSVTKHFDAYADVDWDAPEMAIDPTDPRWELSEDDPLGATDWYRAQPQHVRAEIGLYRIAANMKIGLQFESVLKRGLLEYALALPNGSPEFRYAYHEVIEEAQHSLMFQEFVNRSGLPIDGMPKWLQIASRRVVVMARRFPEMFFIFVLGGEDPIDHVQRETLRSGRALPPVLERIMRIHVTEEARHLSFARHLLKQRVPKLDPARRAVLSIQAPITLGVMASLMLQPPTVLTRRYGVPADLLKSVYSTPQARAQAATSLHKVRDLCVELGLVNPASKQLWKLLRIW